MTAVKMQHFQQELDINRTAVKTDRWQHPAKKPHFNCAVNKSRTDESKWPVLPHAVQTTKLPGTHACSWENIGIKVYFPFWSKQLFYQLKSDSFQELLCAYMVPLLLVLVSSLQEGLYFPGHNSIPHSCSQLTLFTFEIYSNPALKFTVRGFAKRGWSSEMVLLLSCFLPDPYLPSLLSWTQSFLFQVHCLFKISHSFSSFPS